MTYRAHDLAATVPNVKLVGDGDRVVRGPAPLDAATFESFSFCRYDGAEGVSRVLASRAGVVVVPESFLINDVDIESKTLILSSRPRLAFVKMVQSLFRRKRPTGIHQTAFVDDRAKLDKDVTIGAFAYVGEAAIGSGSSIGAYCFIGDDVTIGRNVSIFPGTIIGADGFGYERDDDGVLVKFEHLGGVTIEDDVEIGANTCIDRGTLGNTLIKRGARIDNLVHVAHNTTIGEDAAVIACTMIGGSTKIGNRAWIAPGAVLRDQLNIGDDATVGLGSVLTRDVPPGKTVFGSPAKSPEENATISRALKKMIQE